MRTHILLYVAALWPSLLLAQSTRSYQLSQYRYWFDDETTPRIAAYSKGKAPIDATALDEGFHTLHYQVLTKQGQASPVRTTSFYRVTPFSAAFKQYTVKNIRYWYDDEKTQRTVAYQAGTANFDASALDEGFHTLHYQVVADQEQMSPVRTTSFYRVTPSGAAFKQYSIKSIRYWYDDEKTQRTVAYQAGTANFDASALDEGFHTLHYQVVADQEQMSPVRTISFYRVTPFSATFKQYSIKSIRYWYDDEKTQRTVAYKAGTANFDASALDEGFHTLHYQVVADLEQMSPVRTTSFYRINTSGKTFKDYVVKTVRYWFDNDVSTMRTEAYDASMTTLNLSHLPEGIHTLCYQVVTDDGQLSPVQSINIDRWIYDIYVSRWTEYGDSIVTHDPLFATRPDLKLHYVSDDTNVRGHLTVDEGATLSLGKFVQTANWGNKNDGNKYAKTGAEYYHPTTLLNNGQMRADSVLVKQRLYRDRWHFLALPFNVNVSDIGIPDGTYYALRAYDGEARALGEMAETWQNLGKDDKMEAGRGYIVQLTRESSDKTAELTFRSINDPQKNNIFTTADVAATLQEHQAEFAHNRSWNLIGNPYPSFYDSRSIDHDGTIIVWNGNGYTAYSLSDDSYILMPFEAFFIQKPLNADVLTFAKDGRQHTHEVQPRAASSRRAAKARQNRRVLNFMFTDGTDTDRSRVVINEQATMGYETEKDAPKFMESKPQMPQLFSVESGVQYAINERPMGDGQIAFSIFAPTDGEYRFSVEGDADNMVVMDAETGTVWSMADGDYEFSATEGMHQARLMVSLTGEATAIAQVNAYNDGEIKVTDGRLSFSFMRTKHIKVFGLDGRMIFNDAVNHADVKVSHGVYLVEMDGKTTKIMVK